MEYRSFIAGMLCAVIAPAAELPVRTVALYKHGVGYFERSGTLAAGESARLDFDADAMNDVLKSLTINERGGKVAAQDRAVRETESQIVLVPRSPPTPWTS